MEFDASFSTHGEAFELVEQGEGLLDDVAELAQVLDVRSALAGGHRHDPATPQLAPHGLRVVGLVTQDGLGPPPWPTGTSGDRRDAVDQDQGLGDVVDIGRGGDDVQQGAASVADQMAFAACLPPVDRRRTAWTAPSLSHERGSRPRTRGSSRVRRPRSAGRAASGGTGRRLRPAASDPAVASRSVRSRTPAPVAGVARPHR